MSDTGERRDGIAADGGVRGFEPAFVDVDGTRTRYYDVGSGDPLVLLHGGIWGGVMNANSWAPTFEHLGRSFRVIAVDRMACGLTDNPDAVDDFHWHTEREHAQAFVESLGLDRCHVAGFSRGGGLAARLAVDDPDRFETLTILNSATFGPWAGDRAYIEDRVFERYAPNHDPTSAAYARRRYELYSYRTDHVTDEYCETAAWMRRQPTARETNHILDEAGRREVYEATKHEAMTETHARIKDGGLVVPVLYCVGRNDLTVDLQTGLSAFDMIAQHNRDVRLHLINRCGHLIHREVPEEFSGLVAGFVDQMT